MLSLLFRQAPHYLQKYRAYARRSDYPQPLHQSGANRIGWNKKVIYLKSCMAWLSTHGQRLELVNRA